MYSPILNIRERPNCNIYFFNKSSNTLLIASHFIYNFARIINGMDTNVYTKVEKNRPFLS